MNRALPYIGGTLIGALIIAIQYGFAIAGEPRLHWLYCQILSMCS